MSAIARFLASHPKLISVAFIVGVISLIIKILDDRLPETAKKRFSEWIEAVAPHMKMWDIEAMYAWAKRNLFLYMILYFLLLSTPIIALTVISKEEHFLILISVPAVYSALSLKAWVQESFRVAFRRWLRIVLYGIVIGELIMGVCLLFFYGGWERNQVQDIGLADLGNAMLTSPMVMLALSLALWGPLWLLVSFRPAIGLAARAVWWLATYPKGAWAGLVWVLTLALGVLRLFL
jgi:hypothetical protein